MSDILPILNGIYASKAQGALADGAAQKSNNLSDLANAATSRTNLGLGDSATKNVGTTAGTVAAGDDGRIVGAVQNGDSTSKVSFQYGGTGSVSRTMLSKGQDIMDVRDFLASDGSDLNNPTVNLASKINYATRILANRGGGRVIIPDGILYAAGIRLYTGVVIEGQSRFGATLKAPAATTSDIIFGMDLDDTASAYTYFGTSTYNLTKGSNRSGIRNLTLDGNFRGGAVSGPFVAWGYGTIVQDVIIKDAGRDGLRTEWTDGSVPMEGTFENIIVDTAQWHGWRNLGPHDSLAKNVIVVDASQGSSSVYHGILASNSRYFNAHVWSRSTTNNRCNYGVYSNGYCEFIACHFEGQNQQFYHGGSGDKLIGCSLYAPFGPNNAALVVFGGNDNLHVGNTYRNGSSAPLNPNTYALQFGFAGTPVSGNAVHSGLFYGFAYGSPFNFANSGGLNSVLQCRGYAGSGGATSFAGSVQSSDEIDYVQGGTVINYRKPAAYGSYANDAAASSGGVPIGGVYRNSSTNALTVRTV